MLRSTRIGVDIGGTFTDFVLHDAVRGITHAGKRLTTPEQPSRAIIEGVERLLIETGTHIRQIHSIVHGTTLITNTVLERTGAKVGLLTTEGFRDILEMGREIRYDVDDLGLEPVPVIVPRNRRIGIGGRLLADSTEHEPIDLDAVRRAVSYLVESEKIEALAISFLHSYRNPAHERAARQVVGECFPELLVSLSSEVAPEIREYERTNTTCVNAYVQPRVQGYMNRLLDDLRYLGFGGELYIMLSGGGITTIEEAKAFPVRLIESGPAAGALAAAFIARSCGEERVISFDMGGTTAKMCLIDDHLPHLKHEFEAGRMRRFKQGSGLPLRVTVIDMIEIGAGGGSIATTDPLGLLKVGPRSASSVPGPVCYGRGGTEPTVTDADLLLGYLNPYYFLGGEMSLDVGNVRDAVGRWIARPLGVSTDHAVRGIQEVVNESMAAATRMHMAEKGRDPRNYTMIAFGGAGPVHAYGLAKLLKLRRIIVPMGAGVISALGFLVAPPAVDEVRGYVAPLAGVDWKETRRLFDDMERRARSLIARAGGEGDDIIIRLAADMRYAGQGFEVITPLSEEFLQTADIATIEAAFHASYRERFGRSSEGIAVEVVNWRLSASLPAQAIDLARRSAPEDPMRGSRNIYFAGFGELEAKVLNRYALVPGQTVEGPAVFEERESSFVVGPDCLVRVDAHLNLIATINNSDRQ